MAEKNLPDDSGLSRRKAISSMGAGLLGVGSISTLGESTNVVDVLKRSLELRKENDWSVLR